MLLKEIATKQKRLKDWKDWLEHETQDPQIRRLTGDALKEYSDLLFRCWELGQISAADGTKLQDLERKLEQLNEEARLRVVPQWTKLNS